MSLVSVQDMETAHIEFNPPPITAEHHALMLQVQRDRALEEAAVLLEKKIAELKETELQMKSKSVTDMLGAAQIVLTSTKQAIRALKSTVPDDAAFEQFKACVMAECDGCAKRNYRGDNPIPEVNNFGITLHRNIYRINESLSCKASKMRAAFPDFSRRLNEQVAGSDKQP